LMHEIAETITDATPRGTPGIVVTPGPSWAGAGDNSGEVADFEAANYDARINGGLVQSYWSAANGVFVIPDGGPADVVISAKGVLTINGDQSASPDDTITLSVQNNEEVININGQ